MRVVLFWASSSSYCISLAEYVDCDLFLDCLVSLMLMPMFLGSLLLRMWKRLLCCPFEAGKSATSKRFSLFDDGRELVALLDCRL